MMKKTAYIGIILLIAVFAIVILFINQGAGYIKIDAPGFETDLTLRNKKTSLFRRKSISILGSEPARIRAGSYMPERIVLRRTEGSNKWWSLVTRGNSWGRLGAINVIKDQTTNIELGPPLTIQTEVQQKQRNATISVSLTGRAGEKWSPQLLTPDGPQTAELKIFDETGNVLAAGRCRYG
jgi:hypothetical protein